MNIKMSWTDLITFDIYEYLANFSNFTRFICIFISYLIETLCDNNIHLIFSNFTCSIFIFKSVLTKLYVTIISVNLKIRTVNFRCHIFNKNRLNSFVKLVVFHVSELKCRL